MKLLVMLAGATVVTGLAACAARAVRRRGLGWWVVAALAHPVLRRPARRRGEVHVLLCIADHFEPRVGGADPETARARVDAWVREYPRLLGGFRDADGRPPRHTFFFPIDEYDEGHVDALAGLCRQGYGEVEVHLHHDGDTADSLRSRLNAFTRLFVERHGLLARRKDTGAVAYGFVHGNWALDNSRPDGRWCGVNNEIDVLRETGCYADFTMPSAPSPTQSRTINRVYYAVDDPARPRSHDSGIRVGAAPAPAGGLMLIQGPLLFDWGRRKWGVIPRLENGDLQGHHPPDGRRLDLWVRAGVCVPQRPDWLFVKLHTHGANGRNSPALLGEPMVRFHEGLARRAAGDPNFHVHYVTAREMYNLARAAEAGWEGGVADARDFALVWEPGPPRGRPAAVAVSPGVE